MANEYPLASSWEAVKSSAQKIPSLVDEITDLDKQIDAFVQMERPATLVEERARQLILAKEAEQLYAVVKQFEAEAIANEMAKQKKDANPGRSADQIQQTTTHPAKGSGSSFSTATTGSQENITLQNMQRTMFEFMDSVQRQLSELRQHLPTQPAQPATTQQQQ